MEILNAILVNNVMKIIKFYFSFLATVVGVYGFLSLATKIPTLFECILDNKSILFYILNLPVVILGFYCLFTSFWVVKKRFSKISLNNLNFASVVISLWTMPLITKNLLLPYFQESNKINYYALSIIITGIFYSINLRASKKLCA